ncbi:hypothetical protein PENTCL1PPCAC_19513, partial [Pristionchus entomophagus]
TPSSASPMAVTSRSVSLLNSALLLIVVASLLPSALGLTFYVPREKTPDTANMELEKAVREMLGKMDPTEVDNIKNYCEISSEKMPIPSTQKSLIVMCQVLGYKPMIAQVKPKRSLSSLTLDRVLRPSTRY